MFHDQQCLKIVVFRLFEICMGNVNNFELLSILTRPQCCSTKVVVCRKLTFETIQRIYILEKTGIRYSNHVIGIMKHIVLCLRNPNIKIKMLKTEMER